MYQGGVEALFSGMTAARAFAPAPTPHPSGRRGPLPSIESVSDAAETVRAAIAGDQRAWDVLVDRYTGLIWAITRAHRLRNEEAADVNQVVWLRLVESLSTLREPDRVGAWLATVARHECLRLIRRAGRELLTDEELLPGDAAFVSSDPVDLGLLGRERDAAVSRAFARLPARCQTLLRVLMADPRPGYEEVAAGLDMPIGSIGPTRQRCIDRLRRDPELREAVGDV